MPTPHGENSCPFCGAEFETGAHRCPSCDLPLLGADGSHPPQERPAPFDGATIFDESQAAVGVDLVDNPEVGPPLATRSPGTAMRCAVVAMNQAEADMLCQMLRAQGILSVVRTPDLHSYGGASLRCEVLVPESQVAEARRLLHVERTQTPTVAGPTPAAVFILLAGITLVALTIAVALALLPN